MTRSAAILLGFLLVGVPYLAAQDAPKTCKPTKAIDLQSRAKMKHRQPGTAKGARTSVTEMLAWGFPNKIDLRATRTSQRPIDDLETKIFTLDGNLWRIALQGEDCSLGLELSDISQAKTAQRVIARIPQENEQTRRRLTNLLASDDRQNLLRARRNAEGNYSALNLSSPLRLRVTGYAFYDAPHYSPNWQRSKGGRCRFTPEQVHQRGYTHGTCAVGTLWELHPVWDVKKLQ